MPKFYTLFIGFSLSILALNSCVQEPDYSTTPEISFASIRKINKIASDGFGGTTKIDSLIMSINFKDGDGDLDIVPDAVGIWGFWTTPLPTNLYWENQGGKFVRK